MNLTNVNIEQKKAICETHTLNPFTLKIKNRQLRYLFMDVWLQGKNVKKTNDYHKTEDKDDL